MIARKTLTVLTLALVSCFSGGLAAQEPAPETEAAEAEVQAPEVVTPPEEPIYSSRRARDQALLAQALPEEVRWLELSSGQQLALYKPVEARITRGALLILQGQMDPPGWHPLVDSPRQALPRQGWATLALSLPPANPPSPPPRPLEPTPEPEVAATEETEAEAEQAAAAEPAPAAEPVPESKPEDAATSSSAPEAPREELIQQSLDAALNWLANERLRPVALMVDASLALEVLAQLEARPEPPIEALILLNRQNHKAFSLGELEKLFGNPSLPVLDVFVMSEQTRLAELRQRHKGVALRQQLEHYRQWEIPEPSGLTKSAPWVEQVRGFMQRKSLKR